MKKLLTILLISTLSLTACTSNKLQELRKEISNNSNEINQQKNDDNLEEKDQNKSFEESSNKVNEGKDIVVELENISDRVRDYIINGQEDKSEAQKLKWSKIFLNEVNIDSLYQEYIKNGGEKNNIEELALYITENAPILSNWEELFKKDLFNSYGEVVIKLEPLGGDLYQAYVIKEGKEVPYVVVSSRTGYFHG
ncbi:hypothetical protein [Clostridium nigeriense]|uniref:hypothetical protein n=1 Tax=Clostridium nigeriense TaxID=1805470 RepID=UPI00082C587B|nr:hypothetical protein [Clostridium nigeriense]